MALRNLFRRGNRLLFLAFLLAFSSMIIFMLTSVFDTMIYNLKQKGSIYYGGDIDIKGIKDMFDLIIDDPEPLMSELRKTLPSGSVVSRRINYRNSGISLFFAGDSIRQRIVNGVDFRLEESIFKQMNFREGSYEGMIRTVGSTPGILISEPAARLLKVRAGDDLLLYIPTVTGQINTATVIVKGVFRDSSLFGFYTAYMDIEVLQDLIRLPKPQCTDIAVYFPRKKFSEEDLEVLHGSLEKKFPLTPLFPRLQDLWAFRDANGWSGMKYAFVSLKTNLERVNELLNAMRLIAYGLYGILLGIVFFGVTNSYRIAFYERRKEIGTLRAMGMRKASIVGLFLLEGLALALLSVSAGAMLADVLLLGLERIDFSFIAGMEIFLNGGFLKFNPTFLIFLHTLGLSLVAVLFALFKPTLIAASVPPVEAMRENR